MYKFVSISFSSFMENYKIPLPNTKITNLIIVVVRPVIWFPNGSRNRTPVMRAKSHERK